MLKCKWIGVHIRNIYTPKPVIHFVDHNEYNAYRTASQILLIVFYNNLTVTSSDTTTFASKALWEGPRSSYQEMFGLEILQVFA